MEGRVVVWMKGFVAFKRMDMMGLFCIIMGVWVIGFRDIGYRACRRLFPWSSSGYGTLGFLLVRSSCFFPAFLFRAMSFEAPARKACLSTKAHGFALVLFGSRP